MSFRRLPAPGEVPEKPLPIASTTPFPTSTSNTISNGSGMLDNGMNPGATPSSKSFNLGLAVGLPVGLLFLLLVFGGVILAVLWQQGMLKTKQQRDYDKDTVRQLSNTRPYTAAAGGGRRRPATETRRPATAGGQPQRPITMPMQWPSTGVIPEIPEKDGGPGLSDDDEHEEDHHNANRMPDHYCRPKTPKGPPSSHLPPLTYNATFQASGYESKAKLPPLDGSRIAEQKEEEEEEMRVKMKGSRGKNRMHHMAVENEGYDSAGDTEMGDGAASRFRSPAPAYSD